MRHLKLENGNAACTPDGDVREWNEAAILTDNPAEVDCQRCVMRDPRGVPVVEWDEAEARALVDELHKIGVTDAVVHWDRSPWGARVPLTEERGEYQTPSLFVLADGKRMVGDFEVTGWIGQLGGFDETSEDSLQETSFGWIVRHWTGETLTTLAERVRDVTDLLKHGAK